MKVLHVIPSMSFAHGGPSHAIRLIERALTGLGVEVETLSTDDDGPGARLDARLVVPHKTNGVVRRYFRKWFDFYKVSPGLAAWVNRHVGDYDLVHIHALFSFSSVVAAWAARSAGVPYVIRPLGTLGRYGIDKRRPWLKRLSLALIEGPILRHAAMVHFTSLAEMQEAEELGYPMWGTVVPLGVEPLPERGNENPFLQLYPQLSGSQVVLYLSRLDPKKNVEGLLKAFSLLNNNDSSGPPTSMPGVVWEGGAAQDAAHEVMLVIAGDGDPAYVASLHRLVRQLGLGDQVLFVGQLGMDMKAGAFNAASIFVLPSFSENFGIAAVEALSAGLPCVLGKDVAISQEIERAGAGVAIDTTPDSIAAALELLLDDEALRGKMAANAARLVADQYSIEAMGKGLYDLYSKILSGEYSR